jgi:multidrug resistance efflux pump
MEILLLGIYSFFVWLIFFKFKWLPWNFISQVVVITIPIVGLTALILFLNIVAPSSADIRVINYVVPINPPVRGLVTEVPIEPNRPIKKGDVLFKIDPVPYELDVKTAEANVAALKPKLSLARMRLKQYKELAGSGAGNEFDPQQAQADVAQLESQLAQAEAQLGNAKWNLEQTTYYAPTNGSVIALTLRPGAMAVPLPMTPAMNFVEDEQWILAIYNQNEVRKIKPGQEAEVAFRMYPGRVVKCKVDSIMWATAQGQLPIGSMNAAGGVAPIPPNSLAVRLVLDGKDKGLFLAAGARGSGAVFTDSGEFLHIIRKVIIRVGAKLDWLILKLH